MSADGFRIPQTRIVNRYKLAVSSIGLSFALNFVDSDIVRRYFGWANQALAAIALWCGAVFLARRRSRSLQTPSTDGCPIGIVSEFDLLELIREGQNDQSRVCSYMSQALYGVSEQDDRVSVLNVFRSKHVRRLPVPRDGKLVGIVTRHDLVHAIRDARRQIHHKRSQRVCESPEAAERDLVPTFPYGSDDT